MEVGVPTHTEGQGEEDRDRQTDRQILKATMGELPGSGGAANIPSAQPPRGS